MSPYSVQKRSQPGKKPRYAIVNKSTGKVAGYSDTKAKAQKSASIRNGTHKKK